LEAAAYSPKKSDFEPQIKTNMSTSDEETSTLYSIKQNIAKEYKTKFSRVSTAEYAKYQTQQAYWEFDDLMEKIREEFQHANTEEEIDALIKILPDLVFDSFEKNHLLKQDYVKEEYRELKKILSVKRKHAEMI
jgi:hypothetical protein